MGKFKNFFQSHDELYISKKITNLKSTICNVKKILEDNELKNKIQFISNFLSNANSIIVLGYAKLLGISNECALKIKEISEEINFIKSEVLLEPVSSKEYNSLCPRPKYSLLDCEV